MMLFVFILLLYLFSHISSILPIWNLEESSEDLLGTGNQHIYAIANREMYNFVLELTKTITRDDVNKIITHKNTLKLGGKTYTVDYENVESFYDKDVTKNIDLKILCPRGSFHPVNLVNMDNPTNINFDNWIKDDKWDLKCYYHSTGFFLIYYLMNGNNEVKYRKTSESEWSDHEFLKLYDEIYDFKLKNQNEASNPYPFLGIVKEGNYLKLIATGIGFENSNGIGRNTDDKLNLIETKQYSQAYFGNSSTDFYFMTYNDVSDFKSGYSVSHPDDFKINSVTIKKNENTPFEFLDEVEIKEMNFLFNNKYVYYTIYDAKTKKTYHGILDIKFNKVMFNTDEEIDVFIPYSTNSMLAITKKSAYKICAIGKSNCIEVNIF